MKAMVYTAPLTLEIRDLPEPEPAPGEVLVQVAAAGVCGSELEGFANQSPFRVPPLVMGHEFAGVRGDTGERVVVNPVISCWRCDLCLRGLPNVCRRRQIIGIHRAGAFADLVPVPAGNCYPLPDHLPAATAALVEPLANAVHAVRLAQSADQLPQRAGVIGCGALGYLTAFTLLRHGVPEVVVHDRSAPRLAVAATIGAHTTTDGLAGEFDLVFDAVGNAVTRQVSVDLVRPGGAAIWIGLHDPTPGFDGLQLVRAEKRVLGTFCYLDLDFRAAVTMASQLPTDLVAERPLASGVAVFDQLLRQPPQAIKTVLVPAGPASATGPVPATAAGVRR